MGLISRVSSRTYRNLKSPKPCRTKPLRNTSKTTNNTTTTRDSEATTDRENALGTTATTSGACEFLAIEATIPLRANGSKSSTRFSALIKKRELGMICGKTVFSGEGFTDELVDKTLNTQ